MTEEIRKLGRFELLRPIAKGGMGEIYLARQRGTAGFEKNLIIKTILPHLADEQEFVDKFLDEGRIVVQLVHGNIVPVFDMGEEEGEYYIAMEYIPGRDVREIQKRLDVKATHMPIDLALHITQEVCKGLDYAHRKTSQTGQPLDIVHRDVSPSNILVSQEGEVKIIDFGIARATSRIGKTVSGRIQGKFCYMSPEQAGGQSVDGRSDVFSAGVVLYELLTGFRPFEGDSDLHTLDLVRKCEFDPPSTLLPEIPAEVDALVAKALEKDPADRYQSADQFQVAILQYLYRGGGSGPTSNDLAAYLHTVFPDGLERDDLRSARDSSPAKNMSLDEAMDFELGKLLDPGIDPHNTTALPNRVGTPTAPKLEEKVDALVPDSTTSEPTIDATRSVGTKRSIGLGIGIGILATIIAVLYFAAAKPSESEFRIESTPPDARIEIDGAILPGAQTPHTAMLPLGRHEIRLSLDGYETRAFQIEVGSEAGALLAADAKLPKTGPPEPRKIPVATSPGDARISVDGTEFAIGSGTLTVAPDAPILVEATREGCTTRKVHLKHGFAGEKLTISLDCEVEPKETDPTTETSPTPKKTKRLTFKSNPPGASISVNGKVIGKAPTAYTASMTDTLNIHATLAGHKDVRMTQKVERLKNTVNFTMNAAEMGCLNLRLGFPAVGRIAIDGTWLPGETGRLKNHQLSAGPHKVRVKNDTVGKDDTFNVTIKPGSACTLKVIWPRG